MLIAAMIVIAAILEEVEQSKEARDVVEGLPDGCAEHVALLSAEHWSEELGRPVSWVLDNHRIRLWSESGSTGSKGRVVGEMLVGSRAAIVDSDSSGHLVFSPLDGSTGWVSHMQVSRILWQDTETRKRCAPQSESGDAQWRIREDGLVECADGRVIATNDPARVCR